MSHDARREIEILNSLNYGKDGQSHKQDNPEVLTRLDALHQGKNDGGDETYQLEIRNQIQETYKEP